MVSLQECRRQHYELEKSYAQKILASPKGSAERARLFREGYSAIYNSAAQYQIVDDATDSHALAEVVRGLVEDGGSVLDVGCGFGALIAELLQRGYDAHGVDISATVVEKARLRLDRLGHRVDSVRCLDFLHAPGAYRDLDCVVATHVLEHIHPDETVDFLVRCHEAVRPGGLVLIVVPHKFTSPNDSSRWFLPLGAKSAGIHLVDLSFTDLRDTFLQAGFQHVLGFVISPKLQVKLGLKPQATRFAAAKALWLERALASRPLSWIFRLNRTLSQALVGLLFPAYIVGVKCDCSKFGG
jgi:2-polyprenyl-3-methyl-5-hydroxy-6-metoxy-1,4-benzoquinol methylase